MFHGDDPIEKASDDALGRAGLAEEIATLIRGFGGSEGVVIGILGPWGAGKTSLINLMEEALSGDDKIPVLHFNPWMFSSADQLIDRFFTEMASQLGQSPQSAMKGIAENVARYGKVLSPLKAVPFAGWLVTALDEIPEAAKALREILEDESGVIDQRDKLTIDLNKLEKPIVVVIDDIDRLTPGEIRDILKLVRLTGSFPSIVYVLAFDRLKVESVLSEPGVSGREFLKKIIQVPIDIPTVPTAALTAQLGKALDEALTEAQRDAIVGDRRWPDVLWGIIRPLFRTIRDVRQYVASLGVTLGVVGGAVSLVDVLALEAIRVFLPDVFTRMTEEQDAFTGLTDNLAPWEENAIEPKRRKAVRKVVKSAGQHRRVVEGMIRRLFPAAERHLDGHLSDSGPAVTWRRDKRVADAAVLAYYLEHVTGHKLQGMQEAERLLPLIGNRTVIESSVQALDPAVWPDVIGSWWLAVDQIPTDAIPQVVAAVMNLVAAAPDRHRKPFEYDTRSTGLGLVWRLLARLPDNGERDVAVESAMKEIDTLLGKVELHQFATEKDRDGTSLISPTMADVLKEQIQEAIRNSNADRLVSERELFQVLSWAKRHSSSNEPTFEQPFDQRFAAALLKTAARRTYSKSSASVAVSLEVGLNWDELVSLMEGEDHVRRLVEVCQDVTDDQELQEATKLASQHLDGKAGR